jgi:hypothetical protein
MKTVALLNSSICPLLFLAILFLHYSLPNNQAIIIAQAKKNIGNITAVVQVYNYILIKVIEEFDTIETVTMPHTSTSNNGIDRDVVMSNFPFC